MLWYHYVFGAVLIVFSIVITIVVLMQEGRSQNLSGAIAGGADTFLGKSKGRTIEAKLERITKWMIVVFLCVSILSHKININGIFKIFKISNQGIQVAC